MLDFIFCYFIVFPIAIGILWAVLNPMFYVSAWNFFPAYKPENEKQKEQNNNNDDDDDDDEV